MWEVLGVKERGTKKSLKKNRDEERKGRKMGIFWSLKIIEGLIYIIKKYQRLICIFLKVDG